MTGSGDVLAHAHVRSDKRAHPTRIMKLSSAEEGVEHAAPAGKRTAFSDGVAPHRPYADWWRARSTTESVQGCAMALRYALLGLASALSIFAACGREGPPDFFCPSATAEVYVPNGNECGTGITGLEVEAPCTAECDDPGYPPDCPGPCIVWKVSASQPTACRFTVHFKHAPDFSDVVTFDAVTPSQYCPNEIAGSQYTLPMGVASRSGDASVETGAAANDAAVEADAPSDAGDGAIADAGDAG